MSVFKIPLNILVRILCNECLTKISMASSLQNLKLCPECDKKLKERKQKIET